MSNVKEMYQEDYRFQNVLAKVVIFSSATRPVECFVEMEYFTRIHVIYRF